MKSKIVFYDQKMEIPTVSGFVVCNYDDLMYVIYDAPYCWLHFTENKKYKLDL